MKRWVCFALAGVAAVALAGCDDGVAPVGVERPRGRDPVRVVQGRTGGVRCGVVWDPTVGAIDDGRVVFEGDHVSSLGPASTTPRAEGEVDLRPLFCMPGFVDAHTHLTSYAHQTGTDAMDRRRAEAARNAGRTLNAGVTSVRDLGGEEGVDLWLRARITTGGLPGPRMQCAGGQIGSNGAVGGVAGAKAAVDAHAEAGFDVIKLFATGGADDPILLMTAQEMVAATDEAHAHDLRVAVHAITAEGIDRSIAARVDSIEHGSELTVEQASTMASAGIALVPTLFILRYYVEDADNLGLSADRVADLRRTLGRLIVPFERRFPSILATGVKVAFGSDSFMAMHGKNLRELEYMVEAGMTPEQALRAGTATSAALMGWEGKVGSLAPGAYADLVAMRGDPRKDISAVARPSVVLKGGVVVRSDRW